MGSYCEIDYHALTHTGREHETNEDQFLIAELNKSLLINQTSLELANQRPWFGGRQGRLFVVADGLGGHPGGEEASAVAVDTLLEYIVDTMPWLYTLPETQSDTIADELQRAMHRCEQRIKAQAGQNSENTGMGTTLTMAYVIWPHLYVVHVGDSRCYLYRRGTLERVTHDHTVSHRLAEDGVLPEENVETSRWSKVLWNVVGGHEETYCAPEAYHARLESDDKLVLCTKGLTKHLSDEDIGSILGAKRRAHETSYRLISTAIERGGRDNVTAIVARFVERRTVIDEARGIPDVSREDVDVLEGAPPLSYVKGKAVIP